MPRVKTIAITRPLADAQRVAAEMEEQGIASILVPMLRIEAVAQTGALEQAIQEGGVQALCITSKHALPALAGLLPALAIPLYTVGSVTAEAARGEGFTRVIDAGGNVQALLALMQQCLLPDKGKILYARGADVACDLAGALRTLGYAVQEEIVYAAVATDALPEEFLEAVRVGGVDEVWFYSERSAANYQRLALRYGLVERHASMGCRSLSEKIARQVKNLPWRQYTAMVPSGQ